ncbi:MAG: Gfo/Idh/MocA family oxidoreductase [Pyrinomonadaceae bacterium]|nr:Gfo/Idh/MocA family oxidoreductase [Pyrinomonadaceae bacterium]MCX7639010.1 Gfo/Idh/MocA family oxidoreductase [Pyrinomonadaceae bacterium]MDW8303770.1 Gfo/Idh/MocA family oxidoreductase [Acidobacteriota bacterium]
MASSQKKLRAGVVGVGSLGKHHARNYAEIAKQGFVELVAVCDIDLEKAKQIADQFNCRAFDEWKQMIEIVDVVSVVTPTETHCEISCGFLERGVSVLVEKPISRTIEEADKMVEAAKSKGVKLMVGHLERYNPAMVALRPHVVNPLYFEIHRISPFPNRSLDVDVVLDVMIHDLDAVQWLVGKDVKVSDVHAVGIPVLSDKIDAANARIEFENGAVANITASRIGTEKIRKTRFYQPYSYVVLDYATRFASLTSLISPNSTEIKINRLEVEDFEPLRAEIEAFLNCVIEDTEPPISGEDGRQALVLALKVLEKIEQHRNRLNV